MKPSEKMLQLLKKANEDYINAIESGEDDHIILNAYMSILTTLTMKFLEYKRKENKER